jgi:hypothetical protein
VSGKNDHQYFGRPEHATNERPIYLADSSSPGADLAGEYAAAYAAGAVLFKSIDPAYAAMLYGHAQQAFTFASTYKSKCVCLCTDGWGADVLATLWLVELVACAHTVRNLNASAVRALFCSWKTPSGIFQAYGSYCE